MKPDKQGYYWYREYPTTPWGIVFVYRDHVTHETDEEDFLWALQIGRNVPITSMNGEWSKRIQPPK